MDIPSQSFLIGMSIRHPIACSFAPRLLPRWFRPMHERNHPMLIDVRQVRHTPCVVGVVITGCRITLSTPYRRMFPEQHHVRQSSDPIMPSKRPSPTHAQKSQFTHLVSGLPKQLIQKRNAYTSSLRSQLHTLLLAHSAPSSGSK